MLRRPQNLFVRIITRVEGMHPSQRLAGAVSLELAVYPDHLGAILINASPGEIRVWEPENSWGWFNFAVEVARATNAAPLVVRRRPREWTRNMPRFFTLRPGERRELPLRLDDGWWLRPPELDDLRHLPLQVRLVFTGGPSPQADEHGVLVGTVSSGWVVSQPPHGWLFGRPE